MLRLRLVFAPARLGNESCRADAEHLGDCDHQHAEVTGERDSGDRFLAEPAHPIEIRQEVKRLRQHADGEESRHLDEMPNDRALREIFHRARLSRAAIG